MSLYKKVIEKKADVEGFPWHVGYNAGIDRAAQLAKEADELIDWTRAHLETLRQLADSASSFEEAQMAIKRIDKWKDQTND